MNDADITNDCNVATDANIGGCDRGLDSPGGFLCNIKIEAVKVKSFDQVACSFRFETGEVFAAKLAVRVPVTGGDAVQQTRGQIEQQFVFMHS